VAASRIHEQLKAAHVLSGWSVPELLEKSGLELHYTSLARKLDGEIDLKTNEAETLVDTFRKHGHPVTIVWPKRAA
jgi:hypothetical protein